MEAFEMIEVGEESSVGYVGKISTTLLSSPSKFFSARGDSRCVDFFISNEQNDGWYFIAYIYMDDPDYNPNPSECAILIYPLKSKIADHLHDLITLQLFEPRTMIDE